MQKMNFKDLLKLGSPVCCLYITCFSCLEPLQTALQSYFFFLKTTKSHVKTTKSHVKTIFIFFVVFNLNDYKNPQTTNRSTKPFFFLKTTKTRKNGFFKKATSFDFVVFIDRIFMKYFMKNIME